MQGGLCSLPTANASTWGQKGACYEQLNVALFLVGPGQRDQHHSRSEAQEAAHSSDKGSIWAVDINVDDLADWDAIHGINWHSNKSCVRLGHIDLCSGGG